VVRGDYPVGVPESGVFRELFNSDASIYGGSNVGNQGYVQTRDSGANDRPCTLRLALPPLATLFLKLDRRREPQMISPA